MIYAAEPDAFGPGEVALLKELADDLSYGVGRLRDGVSLRASEQRFRTLAASAPIGVMETSASGMVEFANAQMAEITGRSIEELTSGHWLDMVHAENIPAALDVADQVRGGKRAARRFAFRSTGGEIKHIRVSVAPKSAAGDQGHVVTVEDVTDEALAQEALAHQAFHDPLTGLPNRAFFLHRLEDEMARQKREGAGVAVLFLDLDNFKVVNDSLGHFVGDEVLRQVARRYSTGVRKDEVVARFSGDEFMFIVHGVRSADEAVKAATRLLGLTEPPVHSSGHEIRVTASIGIVLPRSQPDAAAVLRDADTAMYRAKAAGRNGWAVFDDALHARSVNRLALEADLHHALGRRELELYYQPLVEPSSGRPLAAEVLVRWHSPERGLVPPLEFIPLAEETGLIRPIGRWIFEQAVAQLARWDRQAGGPRLEVLAINLSAPQLDDSGTAVGIEKVLARHGIAPERICVEVTESVLMADSVSTRATLEAFRTLGLRVAIDDFGTGYSSLAYLHALPVTTVKVDRSFVERLGSEDDSTAVVKAIIEMSHAMGLDVVAEGVSSGRLMALVSVLGCQAAQGFYWAKPVPSKEFGVWWRRACR